MTIRYVPAFFDAQVFYQLKCSSLPSLHCPQVRAHGEQAGPDPSCAVLRGAVKPGVALAQTARLCAARSAPRVSCAPALGSTCPLQSAACSRERSCASARLAAPPPPAPRQLRVLAPPPVAACFPRRCLARSDKQCSFVEHRSYKARCAVRPVAEQCAAPPAWSSAPPALAQVIYRRYASLFVLVAVDGDENELSVLEFIHCLAGRPQQQRPGGPCQPRRGGCPAPLGGLRSDGLWQVETLDKYFGNVCELDIMFNLEKVNATAAAFPPKRHSPHSSRPGRGPAGCGAQSAGGAALNPEPGQAHYILDEMVMNGCMVETNRLKILTPVQLLDKIEAAT